MQQHSSLRTTRSAKGKAMKPTGVPIDFIYVALSLLADLIQLPGSVPAVDSWLQLRSPRER
jgi:hypothetical protein